jgi:hypothetical protein
MELRGFAQIGTLEYWSAGVMGIEEEKPLISLSPLLLAVITLFQHSIIPWDR